MGSTKTEEPNLYPEGSLRRRQRNTEDRRLLKEREKMRFRSTGLGKTELKGEMSDLSPVGEDLLVYHIQTYEPVKWELRAAMERKDVPKIVKGFLKPSILFHVIRTLFHVKKKPKEIEDIMDKSLGKY